MADQGERTFRLHKMDDRRAYDLMVELKNLLGISDPIRIRLLHGYEFDDSALGEEACSVGKYQVSHFEVNGLVPEVGSQVGFSASFNRYANQHPDQHDNHFDYVVLHFGNQYGAWSSHIKKILKCIDTVASKDVAVVPEHGEDGNTLRSLIMSQDAAHQRMIDDLHKSIREMAERRSELETAAALAEAERREAHAKAQQELDEQKAALERQSHMATRRNIGRAIHKIMSGSEQATLNRRRSMVFAQFVFAAYFTLGVAGATGTYLTFRALDQSTTSGVAQEILSSLLATEGVVPSGTTATAPPVSEVATTSDGSAALIWFLLLKFLVSSALTIFGFVSAATWLRRYLDTENRHEEDRLAYAADIERASWVIEAIHEVKHEAKGELPKEWVDAVTRNLFAPRQSNVDLDEGAQALRALIGLAGSAKVGPQGLEMEFNKKGTKALGEGGQ